jgi:hypothetical protein
VESECKVCSSKLQKAGNFISVTDGISIKAGIEMGLFPLLAKEAIESVSVFISGKTKSGFMISASTLSADVSSK